MLRPILPIGNGIARGNAVLLAYAPAKSWMDGLIQILIVHSCPNPIPHP